MNRRKKTFSIILLILILILVIFFLRKCDWNNSFSGSSKGELKEVVPKENAFHFIPDDAAFIFILNTPQLLNEIDFDSLRSTQKYFDMLTPTYNDNPPFTQVFANPEGCGVEPKQNCVFYIDLGETADEVYSASVIPLKNAQIFQMMVEQELKDKAIDANGYKYMEISDGSQVAWTNNMAIFITSDETFDKSKALKSCFGDVRENYFGQNGDFREWVKSEKGDVIFWLDMNAYERNQLFARTQGREEMDAKYLTDVIYSGTANFSIGEIDIKFNTNWNDHMRSLMDQVFEKSSPKQIFKNVPGQNISLFTSFSLNLEGLTQYFLDDIKIKLQARNALREYGLVIQDFKDALTGDFAFVSYPNPYDHKATTLIIAGIKEKEKVDYLLGVGLDLKSLVLEEENIYILPNQVVPIFPVEMSYADLKPRLLVKDDFLYISGNNELIEHLRDTNTDLVDDYFYMDQDDSFENALASGHANRIHQAVEPLQKKLNINSFYFHYLEETLHIKLFSVDRKTSSLKQLLSLSN